MGSLPGLLRLPRELRDEIYTHVLDDHEVPPPQPSASGSRISEGTLRLEVPQNHRQLKKLSLARTNRGLRDEINDNLSTIRELRGERPAELDIMFEDYVSWPTWIYLPPETTREVPFDLNVHIRVFSVHTFTRYDEVANPDGWNLGDMSAPFLDLLILLKRLVRFGPLFLRPSHVFESDVDRPDSFARDADLFKLNLLSVSVTFENATCNEGNSSNIIKCLKRFARCGLARGVIRRLEIHTRFHNDRGEVRRRCFKMSVYQEVDEERMQRCIELGFCHTSSETLANGPLENGVAVKINKEDWECG